MKKLLLISILSGITYGEVIPEIVVSEEKGNASEEAKSTYDQKKISRMLQGNGDIGSAIKLNPNLEVEDKNSNKDTLADITPSKIKINGAKFYQNAFLVDGLSNSSTLDPAYDHKASIQDVPGNENATFISLDLIESIDVYDSFIPAKYGSFNGGVIDVKTKRADFTTKGNIKFRKTDDSLVEFKLKKPENEDEANDIAGLSKPKYEKNFLDMYFTTPINEKSAIWASYSYKESTTPQQTFGSFASLKSFNHNFHTKYSYFFDDDSIVDLSFIYAPYEEEQIRENVRNSAYSNEGGGINLKANYEKNFNFWKLKADLGLSHSENSRTGSARDFKKWNKGGTKNWGLESDSKSLEGGYGNIEKKEDYIRTNLELESKPFLLGELENTLSTGLQLSYGKANYLRKEDTYVYTKIEESTGIQCNGSTEDCDEGYQFFTDRTIYKAEDVDADILEVGTYIDDTLKYKRLEFTPGFRADYNDYLQNIDLAYRLNTSFDIFGDGKSKILAGANRYYGKSFLGFKLREARTPYKTEYRAKFANQLNTGHAETTWNPSTDKGDDTYIYQDLDTPYTDELALGFKQKFLKNELLVKYIKRKGKNQFKEERGEEKPFTRPDGFIAYYTPISVSNGGENQYNALTIGIENTEPLKFFNSNFFYYFSTNINTVNSSNFNTYELEPTVSKTKIYYNGEQINYHDLEKEKDPQIFKLNLSFEDIKYKLFNLDTNMKFSTLFTYYDDYKAIVKSSQTINDIVATPSDPGNREDLAVYNKNDYKAYWTMDLKADFDFNLIKKQTLTATIEIVNVFDKEDQESIDRNYYNIGRQFWFQVAYKF